MEKKETELTFEIFWREPAAAGCLGNIAVRVMVGFTVEIWKEECAKSAVASGCLNCRGMFVTILNENPPAALNMEIREEKTLLLFDVCRIVMDAAGN